MDLTLGIIFPVALISHYIIWKLSQKREKPLLESNYKYFNIFKLIIYMI